MVIDLRSIRDGCAVGSAATRMGYLFALLLFSTATFCLGIEPGFYGISDQAAREAFEAQQKADRVLWFGAELKCDLGLGRVQDGLRTPIYLARAEVEDFLKKEKHRALLVVWCDKTIMGSDRKDRLIADVRAFTSQLGFSRVLLLGSHSSGVHVIADLETSKAKPSGAASGSQPKRTEEVLVLVEQLVSPIGPPGPEITEYTGSDKKKVAASLKAVLDGYEHPQVTKAIEALVGMGPAIFPELVRYRQDKRYSYSFTVADWHHCSVGDAIDRIMEEVVTGRFSPVGYKTRKNARSSNSQPSFRQMLNAVGFEEYSRQVEGMTRDQAEAEYVKWYSQREIAYGFTDSAQEDEILAPILKRLSELNP